jgi:hypothetical protein
VRYLLQTGAGMMSMNRELLRQYRAGREAGVILWPRTMTPEQVERHAREVHEEGGSVLFDPCFYVPHTERAQILNFPYWEGVSFETTEFTGDAGRDFCRRAIDYQVHDLKVTEVLLPGRYTNVVNEDWLAMHRMFAETARDLQLGRSVYSTIALGPDVIQDRQSLDSIPDEVTQYPVEGVYLLYRSPNDEYLTDDTNFLMGLLVAGLSLSLADKEVIVGYANQQDLLLAAAGVRTIASGNFRNVRRFNPEIFDTADPNELRRGVWFYDGNSLCEFRPPDLALAYQYLNLRGRFGPGTIHSADLLNSQNPGVVRWGEPEAFRHYLTVHRDQWMSFGAVPRAQRAARVRQFVSLWAAQIALYEDQRFPLGQRGAAGAVTAYQDVIDTFRAIEAPRIAML